MTIVVAPALHCLQLSWDVYMQDMVVFGGVNPAQDLNDVAIWQGM